ncbi:MAG: secretin N-terminal domain-containing protein, partial [Smithellaceae bacterium]|nr:secretin N-terminal domain-containing protein [Smithellaceae bacterium]
QELLLKDVKEGVPPGSVRVDEHSNSLIIQATKDDLVKLVSLIEKVDKPTPQVLIRGNIVETTKSTARTLGVQWGGALQNRLGGGDIYVTAGGTGVAPPGNIMSGGYAPPAGGRGLSGHGFVSNFAGVDMLKAGQSFGSLGLLMGALGGSVLELQLHALQKDGKLNILSSPHITTLDNQMAFTENGEKIPYVALDENGRAVVKYEDAVLRLEITPNTIDDQSMKMKIVVKKDEVDSSRTVDKNPFIVKKHTVTNLIVRDGETIVIAGLTKQRKAEDNTGIPWFKNIPGLGWLFKAEAKDDLMEETMIFITPSIIRPAAAIGIQEGP